MPLFVCAATLTAVAPAQSPKQPQLLGDDFRVPIHTHTDDPEFGTYGIWAAGRGYKVSFHNGMQFIPVLGKEAPHNLPVHWTTESVRIGERELLDGERAAPSHSEWRYKYDYGNVAEVYDVLAKGLEQSFVVTRPDHGPVVGDLVVTGRLRGELTPRLSTLAGEQQDVIELLDADGREVVRYGEAIALDATGKRVTIRTTLMDGAVALTVPAAFVARATWPITVDPLLSPVGILGGSGVGTIESSDVAVVVGTGLRRIVTVFSLPVSASDTDTYAVATDEDFGSRATIYTDLTSSWRTDDPSVAFVTQAGVAGRWVMCFARSRATFSAIRVYVHDLDTLGVGSGSTLFPPSAPTRYNHRRPDIGGSRIGTQALLAYESDYVPDYTTNVHVRRIDADALTFTASVGYEQQPLFRDYERPSVSEYSEGTPLNWFVAVQQRSLVVDEWDITCVRWLEDGTHSQVETLVEAEPGDPAHMIRPSIAGINTRYMVSYLRTDNPNSSTGSELGARRFLWAPTSSSPTLQWNVTLDTANTALFQTLGPAQVTADIDVGNWAIAWQENNVLLQGDRILAARVGYNGAIVDSETAFSSLSLDGAGPAISYDRQLARFAITYGTDGATTPVFGRILTYPVDATNTSYGASCGGSFGAISRPLVGTEFFRVRMTGAQPTTIALLIVGFTPVSTNLGPLGAPGCTLLVDPSAVVTFPVITDSVGDALTTIVGLPAAGDLYLQWLHLDAGVNPLGFLLTEGIKSQVR